MREAHPDCHKPLAPTFWMTGAWAFRMRASGVAAKAGSRGSLKKLATPLATCSSNGIASRHPPCFAREGVEKKAWRVGHVREGELTMSVRATWFVAGVLLTSMFWIVLAQQSYCAGSLADWLHMGDVEECQ